LLSFLCIEKKYGFFKKKAAFQDTFAVQYKILRIGNPIEKCFFEGNKVLF